MKNKIFIIKNVPVMKIKNVLLAILFLSASLNLFAQKDTVYSSTGDVIIGEIKSLSRNVLTFDTDYADSDFKIEWNNVRGLISKSILIVYTKEGGRYTGNLNFDNNDERVVTLESSGVVESFNLDEIVQISTLDKGFWSRIIINIDAGYSLTKANNLSQFTMSGKVNYTADKWRLGGGFNNVFTTQDDVDPITRNEANVDFNRDILGDAFAFLGVEFLESSDQNLDLRTTSKLGVGYYLVRTNSMFFQAGVGLANANEKFIGMDSENSFEGLGQIEFDAFDIGDFSFRAKVSAYPNFTTKGRVRINSDVSLKWDLPLDFYIKASIVHNFDNKPPIEGTDKIDYVFQTGIGWEWD